MHPINDIIKNMLITKINKSGINANSPTIFSDDVVKVIRFIGYKNIDDVDDIWFEEPCIIHHGNNNDIKTNIIGKKVVTIRKEGGIKQKDLLARLQTVGMDISATSLSRLEGQYRLVQDFEVVMVAKALDISVEELLQLDIWGFWFDDMF